MTLNQISVFVENKPGKMQLLTDVLEQLWTLLGSRRAVIGDLKQMIGSALTGAEIAALPERQDGVMIGEVGHLLAGETDALILPGVQDGILSAPESGWLTDPERRRMEETTGHCANISIWYKYKIASYIKEVVRFWLVI